MPPAAGPLRQDLTTVMSFDPWLATTATPVAALIATADGDVPTVAEVIELGVETGCTARFAAAMEPLADLIDCAGYGDGIRARVRLRRPA